MATFWFNGAADAENAIVDWATLGNWWMNADCDIPAVALPTSADDVVVLSVSITGNSGAAASVHDLTAVNAGIAINITVSGLASFDFGSLNEGTTLTGNATFENGSQNDGTVTGNASFTSSIHSEWAGVVGGIATFYDDGAINWGTLGDNVEFWGGSTNRGTVSSAVFNDYSYNYNNAGVLNDATFNDYSNNSGVVQGDASFNQDSLNYGTVSGDATFNWGSGNNSTVGGNATFNGSAFNAGSVSGTATFADYAYLSSGGSVGGDATFTGISMNSGGQVGGNTTFSVSAVQWYVKQNGYGMYGGDVTIQYEKGINGSSILGVI